MTAVHATATPAAPARHSRPAELARAAAAPLVSAALVIALLSIWVISGGAGTVTRIRIEIRFAAIPMRAFTAQAASAIHTAPTYITIRNLSAEPDELTSARTPDASRVLLTGPPGKDGRRPVVTGLAIPAHGSVTLSPFGPDVVLINPLPYENYMTVPLTLIFRRAGRISVAAAVTPPGAP